MTSALTELLKSAAQELPPIESDQFGAKFDVFGDSRLVLIGDGSHGTSEFYRARAAITKRLIEKHGFTHVAVECDWPDAHSIDRYVRQNPHQSKDVPIRVFDHFPRWMWRNAEVQDFIDWLRAHNASLPPPSRTSFNGLDLYSMSASIRAVIAYLDNVDPTLAQSARKRYSCLTSWLSDPSSYGLSSARTRTAACEAGVVKMLTQLLTHRLRLATHPENGTAFLDAEMNARVVRDAERYYRAMYEGSSASWNVRDAHMFSVLSRILKLSPGSKAVVWAHNSHLGDARASSNGRDRGELNLGQLCREAFPGEVSVIGCGTHAGTVAAAHEWDEPMEVMDVVPSRLDSYERAMHDTGLPSFVVDLRPLKTPPMLQRFIGVVYRPSTERSSHYIETVLSEQYDAFVWFDRTSAVHAFETVQPKEALSMGETYPFGV
ncbi:putative erythromycin esterase [Annulohypoxylon maeteangense]|uniref:putative erythromycin esterase n=1 Tax=Annulohypoxylon maeteangense TaxID=1927788 RepID=UPI00200867F2|nr:putative erythromycin esterase [Annulohypoxylon maeteangense]KAI0880086.1 putative erythromycin esterase [Annulohypoxylon maeteangense]